MDGNPAKRLHALDALRGLAALSVIVWHWQHFFAIDGRLSHHWDRTIQPLYPLLKPLYNQGWVAVDLFFALSGFVFFWLYTSAIRENRIAAGQFAILRFSRLYPLYLATLLVVAALQPIFRHESGAYFIYETNDLKRFVTGVLFMQQWGEGDSVYAFNGPAWSISIEVVLYTLFFVFARKGLGAVPAAIAAGYGVLIFPWNEHVGRGMAGFFMGGLACFANQAIRTQPDAKRWARGICMAALGIWCAVGIETYWGPFDGVLRAFNAQFSGPVAIWVGSGVFFAFVLIVSPLTILALSLHEQVLGGNYRRLSFLGDISYAVYMLHFPLQLLIATVAVRYGLSSRPFESPWTMLVFYTALIALGWMSYRSFERPMQKYIRNGVRAGAERTATAP